MSEKTENFILNEALIKVEKFCAYQERCAFDIKKKLDKLAVPHSIQNRIIEILKEKDFLNEKRYCELFIRSKINQNSWGAQKIIQELKKRNITDTLINTELANIPDAKFEKNLSLLLQKKIKSYQKDEISIIKQKLIRFAYSKGYSYNITEKILKEIFE